MCFKNYVTRIFIIFLLFVIPTAAISQKASAELITTVKPAKLKSGEQARDGIKNLFFKDQLLYVANIWSGLQILDVSSVNSPREVGTFITENRSHNVYVEGTKAYLSSELAGVTILDVSNPAAITKLGQVDTQGDATYVVANDRYIYVAEETYGIKIYSVANPASPKLLGSYDTPGWAWGLFLDGKTLYVADKGGGLIILDVTNPANPTRLGQYSEMRYAKTVDVENGIAYVSNGADGLWIFDVSSPSFPKLLSKITVDGYVYHSFKAGNSIFLSNETQKRMDIVNVSDPSNPRKEGDFVTDSKVYAAWKNDVYVFIAADTKTIIVRHNHPPVITPLADMTVDEDSQLLFSAEAVDSDGDEILFTIDNLPQGATFDSSSGVFNWTPTYDQSGIYPNVTITVFENTDSRLSTSSTFKIDVNHINRSPSLPDVADSTITENQKISFTIAEGSDPDVEDKGRLTYRAENLPEGAVFSEKARTFVWTPTYEQSGVYTIDFVVEDPGGLLMRDGATITVTHVDRKPELAEIEDITIDENSAYSVTLNGTDADEEDQQSLSYKAENLPEGAVFDASTATFNWLPTYDQSGQYNDIVFIFTAGNLSDSISVNITVNHVNRPPVLDPISAQSTNENDSLTFTIAGSDPDVEDAGKLVFEASNLPQGASFDAASQTFTWLPSFEQSGDYKGVAFTINDPAGLTDSKTTDITVAHVNRTPQLEDIAAKTTNENTDLTFDLVGSDPDAEDQNKLVYSATGLPDGAQLQGNTFSWTPTYDQSGSYSIEFSITDGILSVSKSTTVTVIHVNRPPVLDEIAAQTVDENSPLNFTVSGSDPDVEDKGKLVLSVQNLPQGAVFDASTGAINWIPSFEQSGEYSIKVINTDSSGLTAEQDVAITVNHVNRTPEFPLQPAQTVDENSPLNVVLVAGTDPDKEDEGNLKYTATDLPQGATFDGTSRTLSWTPSYDQSGKYTVTFSVADAEFKVDQPMEITVNHVNRNPVIEELSNQTIDENQAFSMSINASDPDKEDEGKISVSVSGLPEGATFDAASNTISWTPGFEQSGSYPGIAITATDPAGLTAQTSFDITVNHVNREPVIDPVQAVSGTENEALSFSVSGSDPDKEDEGKLSFSISGAPDGATLEGTQFSWTPSYDQSGEHNITVMVSDGKASASTTVTITVANVNRDPEVSGPSNESVEAGSSLNLSFNGSDPDNDDLSFSLSGAPSGMDISDNGNLSWTPSDDQVGDHTVTVTVSDGTAQANTSFMVSVSAKPAPPQPAPPDTTGN